MDRGSERRRGGLRWTISSVVILASVLLALTPLVASGSGPAPGTAQLHPALHVIPFPGTPDASPRSEIIFSALRPTDLRQVIVTGSSSGSHSGQERTLPDNAGTAFLPRHPFTPGETVTVEALLTSTKAGTASGAPGAMSLSFSFTVAVAGSTASSASTTRIAAAASVKPTVSFHSRPGLHPPPVASTSNPDRSSGEIFITAQETGHGVSQLGPMILNPQGRMVWFQHVTHGTPYNLQVQRYRGQRVLTWWEGGFLGVGKDVILNQSYRTVGVVRGAEGYFPDLHELQITPQGTALIDSFSTVHANLSGAGGPSNGTVRDCIIQEIDIRTGALLWEWHALGHVPVGASYQTGTTDPGGYDYCHMNSIQQLPGGDLLVSFRATWALYKISRKTGRVIWSLGGKHSSFTLGRGANFEWQHDARLHGRRLTLFDDAAPPQEEPQSSAKVLTIDQRKRTARLARRYTHSPPLLATKGGSVEILRNGNVFVGWGGEPDFSEYTPGGRQIFNASVPLYMNTYRAFRFFWTGHPASRPALSVSRPSQGTVRLYASWNGDTQIRKWRVLGSHTAAHLRALTVRAWRGFETAIALPSGPRYLAVQALDGHGRLLRSSHTVRVP